MRTRALAAATATGLLVAGLALPARADLDPPVALRYQPCCALPEGHVCYDQGRLKGACVASGISKAGWCGYVCRVGAEPTYQPPTMASAAAPAEPAEAASAQPDGCAVSHAARGPAAAVGLCAWLLALLCGLRLRRPKA